MPSEPALEVELAAPAMVRAARKRFAQTVKETWERYWDTMGTQVVTAGMGVVSGVLAPRLLGPQGRGILAAVTLWPMTLAFLTTLGMDRAATYFVAKGRLAGSDGISPVATTCLAAALVQGVVAIAAGMVVIPAALRGYGPQAVRLALVFLASAPLVVLSSTLASLLLGKQDTRGYNLYRLVAPATYSGAVLALFLLNLPSLPAVVGFQLLGWVFATLLVLRLVRTRLHPAWRWEPQLTKAMFTYGVKTQAGSISNLLNQRLDQLVMSMFLPSAQLGIYVAAVAFADGLWIIPRGIGVVALADGANAGRREAWRVVKRSLLLAALWLVPGAAALWALVPRMVPALFGSPFASAVLPCRILIPGSCAMGLTVVLFEAARGMNHPEIPAYAETAGLILTAILLAVLLKPYGVVGAALASTLSYLFTLGITGWLLVRRAHTAFA